MKHFLNIITALCLMLFIISLSVTVTLHFRPLYYFDIHYLNIESLSGLSEEEIRQNYDALIDYNSIFNHDQLTFPTLPMSENGRTHFEEVKEIFILLEYTMIVTAILSALLILIIIFKYKEVLFLKLASIFTFVIPGVLALCIGLNWEAAFVTFHHIFFNNDYWIFHPDVDPVILMLPDAFFFHCAAMIIALVILGSILSLIFYKKLNKKINL